MRILFKLCVFLLFIATSGCSKKVSRTNIILNDKPLDVILSYSQGTWKLVYIDGGFTMIRENASDSTEWLYLKLSTNRILFKNSARLTLDTTTKWDHVNVFGDSTFVMHFADYIGRTPHPETLGVNRIFNDTLILYQPGPDGLFFHYIKSVF